ncbi:MAG: hypothetical protein JOZ32_19615 [Bryobacterales bacterium]|nr:hypothetical protein [Bryobacterales bacterium]
MTWLFIGYRRNWSDPRDYGAAVQQSLSYKGSEKRQNDYVERTIRKTMSALQGEVPRARALANSGNLIFWTDIARQVCFGGQNSRTPD